MALGHLDCGSERHVRLYGKSGYEVVQKLVVTKEVPGEGVWPKEQPVYGMVRKGEGKVKPKGLRYAMTKEIRVCF